MNVAANIAEFIVNEILAVPAFLIGLITAVGLAALRKNVGQIIGGGLKATLGFLLIGAGAGLVSASLEPLGIMIQGVSGAQGVIPTNEAIAGIAQEEFGSQVAWLMIAGFAFSLILARFTPLRYVFLTGHHALFMATMLTIILATAGYNAATTVGVGAILLGIMMVAMPALSQPWTRKITGDNSVAMGHFGTLGYIAAGATGRATGKNSPSTEKLKLPSGLQFLRDSMVATALSMVIMYVILAVIFLTQTTQEEAFAAFDSPATSVGNYVMLSVTEGLQFGVAVAVILFGVRTVLAELVPAFQGIAAKVVPGAVPALDCPIVFPYAQNAVLVGFIGSFTGGLLGLGLLTAWLAPAFGAALILPGLVPHFFTGGAAGVYGNATGGRRGALLGGLANGLIITLLPAFLIRMLGEFQYENTTFGDADFGWFGLLVGGAGGLGGAVGLALILLLGLLVLAAAWAVQVKVVLPGWDPAPWRSAEDTNVTATNTPASPELADATNQQPDTVAAASDTASKYGKVTPPQGAPRPPENIDWES